MCECLKAGCVWARLCFCSGCVSGSPFPNTEECCAGVQACACVRVSARVRVSGIRACLCPRVCPRCCVSVSGPVCPPAPCFSLWSLCLYTCRAGGRCVCVHGCGPCTSCACISAHVDLVFLTSVRACAPFCAHLCQWMCWRVRLRGVGAPARVSVRAPPAPAPRLLWNRHIAP